jgi:putative AlgH/UPF0301 family transcriptional regulator
MLEKVRAFEATAMQMEQTSIATEHIIHGGMYTRTVRVPAGIIFTGSLVKRATMLIVNGCVAMVLNDGVTNLNGYNVIPASAGRKQVFVTGGPVELTMMFPTAAKTVEEAEAEFTDEADLLLSRRQDNGDTITITGE